MDDAVSAPDFEGLDAESLAARLKLPRAELFDSVTSTLDVAHALARDGAPTGTLVIAEEQTRGRGRGGKSWTSDRGEGLWTAFVLRPADVATVGVLSLRIGIALSSALDRIAGEKVRLKWPNDLFLEQGKLGGILAEARWRERAPEWVALGVGINVAAPDVETGCGLPDGTSRLEVLDALGHAVRDAMNREGALTDDERDAFDARHLARNREVARPRPGFVAGLAPDGALLIRDVDGVHAVHAGSLRFPEE